MKVEIVALEDETFRLNFADTGESCTPIVPENSPSIPNKKQPTLENPKGHEWFNGTSWGVR